MKAASGQEVGTLKASALRPVQKLSPLNKFNTLASTDDESEKENKQEATIPSVEDTKMSK